MELDNNAIPDLHAFALMPVHDSENEAVLRATVVIRIHLGVNSIVRDFETAAEDDRDFKWT